MPLKLLSKENMTLKERLVRQLEQLKFLKQDLGLDSEGIKVILHHHNQKNPQFNPIKIVARDQLPAVIEEIRKNHNESNAARYQFVVNDGNHYSVLDYDINSGNALVLDAANDFRLIRLLDTLSKSPGMNQIAYAVGKTANDYIQKDKQSCPVFAVSHALTIQGIDIFNHLEQEQVIKDINRSNKTAGIDWKYMPLELVINCQSETLWTRYKQEHCIAFNLSEEHFSPYDAYRQQMNKQSEQIDPSIARLKQTNIIPAVFQNITAPVKAFVNKTTDSNLNGILIEGTPLEAQINQVLLSIDTLIKNTPWSKITRVGDCPRNVLKIQEELKNNKLSPYEKLEKIQKIADSAHASNIKFPFVTTLTGRDAFTNHFYKLLKEIKPTEESIKAMDSRLNNLNALGPEISRKP
ncbi:MAG: YopJ family acetyltransferase [Tatlockia sp.]|jgi:hypothetical protein